MRYRVTAIQAQKRNSQRINVYLDGEFAFGLSRFTGAWLEVGQELSEEKISALKLEDRHEMAHQQAINFINYRMRSEKEVRQNLNKHDVPEFVIDDVVDRLRESGLIDDEKFARQWVDNRLEFRPRSRQLLVYELRQKGISTELIDQTLVDVDDDELAYLACVKHAHKWNDLDRSEFNRKLSNFLARRGFTYGLIASTVERIWSEFQSTE
jgi:regulatory protein